LTVSAFEEENDTQMQIEYAQNFPYRKILGCILQNCQYTGEVIRKPHIPGMQGYASTGSYQHKAIINKYNLNELVLTDAGIFINCQSCPESAKHLNESRSETHIPLPTQLILYPLHQ
jgi:hypothetical protein